MQGKGKCPLPLHSIPKINANTKINTKTNTNNKIKAVYTENLTTSSRTGFFVVPELGFGVLGCNVSPPRRTSPFALHRRRQQPAQAQQVQR
ncbi:MAG TPA: hypothetical protein VGU64_01685, partial [Terriglobales bacterium]|nr:hypothetical protein [Terriglobales bacterium]